MDPAFQEPYPQAWQIQKSIAATSWSGFTFWLVMNGNIGSQKDNWSSACTSAPGFLTGPLLWEQSMWFFQKEDLKSQYLESKRNSRYDHIGWHQVFQCSRRAQNLWNDRTTKTLEISARFTPTRRQQQPPILHEPKLFCTGTKKASLTRTQNYGTASSHIWTCSDSEGCKRHRTHELRQAEVEKQDTTGFVPAYQSGTSTKYSGRWGSEKIISRGFASSQLTHTHDKKWRSSTLKRNTTSNDLGSQWR